MAEAAAIRAERRRQRILQNSEKTTKDSLFFPFSVSSKNPTTQFKMNIIGNSVFFRFQGTSNRDICPN